MREQSRAIISNSLQVFPPFREVGRTALELVREGPGRVRFATGAHGELDPAVSTRRTPQMLARLALVVLTVAADWGPPEPKKRSVRQHDAIDPDMAKKIVEGKGCWWEGTTRPSPRADATRGRVGDDWEGMLTCACTCGSCDQRGPASRRLGRSRRVARGPRRGPRSPGRRGAAELGASLQFAEAVREAAEADAARRLDTARRRPQVLARQMLRLERRHAESAALAHAMLREPASRDGAMALLHPASPQVRARRSPSTSSKTTRSPRARRGSRGQRHPRGIPGRMGEGAP